MDAPPPEIREGVDKTVEGEWQLKQPGGEGSKLRGEEQCFVEQRSVLGVVSYGGSNGANEIGNVRDQETLRATSSACQSTRNTYSQFFPLPASTLPPPPVLQPMSFSLQWYLSWSRR